MDDKATELLVEYFKNSTDAVKEVVVQLNKFNTTLNDVTHKLDVLDSSVDDIDLDGVKKDFKDTSRVISDFAKSLSEEEKSYNEKVMLQNREEINKHTTIKIESVYSKIDGVAKLIDDAKSKILKHLPEEEVFFVTLKKELSDLKDTVSDVKFKLIASASIFAGLVVVIIELLNKYVFK